MAFLGWSKRPCICLWCLICLANEHSIPGLHGAPLQRIFNLASCTVPSSWPSISSFEISSHWMLAQRRGFIHRPTSVTISVLCLMSLSLELPPALWLSSLPPSAQLLKTTAWHWKQHKRINLSSFLSWDVFQWLYTSQFVIALPANKKMWAFYESILFHSQVPCIACCRAHWIQKFPIVPVSGSQNASGYISGWTPEKGWFS